MKREFCIFIVLFLVFHIHAQLVYHDASNFPLLGRATESAGARYERFPDSSKWVALFNTHMNHMTDTGAKGLDLYCLQKNGDWHFVNSARPKGKINQATIIKNMHPEEREYMLYLPLYDGLISLSIGVDSLATISQPLMDYPIRKNPVVFYGTSILQGGCASRPGMAHTNIISRRLNRECINLGFSGNAFLDLETLKEIFNHLKKRNEKNIILISSKNMLGEDGEATIDGIHFTDLGMMRYADLVCPVVKKAIR